MKKNKTKTKNHSPVCRNRPCPVVMPTATPPTTTQQPPTTTLLPSSPPKNRLCKPKLTSTQANGSAPNGTIQFPLHTLNPIFGRCFGMLYYDTLFLPAQCIALETLPPNRWVSDFQELHFPGRQHSTMAGGVCVFVRISAYLWVRASVLAERKCSPRMACTILDSRICTAASAATAERQSTRGLRGSSDAGAVDWPARLAAKAVRSTACTADATEPGLIENEDIAKWLWMKRTD